MKAETGKKIAALIGAFIAAIAFMVSMALLNSIVVYILWNALMPELFKLPEITFMQAIGLMLLTHLLFKNSDWVPSPSSKDKTE